MPTPTNTNKPPSDPAAGARALAIIVACAALICIPLALLIIPKFGVIFESFQVALPALTRFCLAWDGLGIVGVLLVIAAAPIAALMLTKSPRTRLLVPTICAIALSGLVGLATPALFTPLLAIMSQLEKNSQSQPNAQSSAPAPAPTQSAPKPK
jgi:hypothetical protein